MIHTRITALFFLSLTFAANYDMRPILGIKCLPNQVVTKLTVYEDGAVEAECNKLPCGTSGAYCNDNQTNCRAETDTFSGMKWASNGQSILQRCCALSVPRKIYVGTDLVSLGSYYTGGMVDMKDLYSKEGSEFDFVSNIRTEQGGVRVWVYRVICPKSNETARNISAYRLKEAVVTQSSDVSPQAFEKHFNYHHKESILNGNNHRDEMMAQNGAYRPINPLQYRPVNVQQDLPIDMGRRGSFERLI